MSPLITDLPGYWDMEPHWDMVLHALKKGNLISGKLEEADTLIHGLS